jgi:hypothetical protein
MQEQKGQRREALRGGVGMTETLGMSAGTLLHWHCRSSRKNKNCSIPFDQGAELNHSLGLPFVSIGE